MDEKTEELIKRIAAKHHIALDETDPIMVVPTMIEFLFEESRQQQETTLNELKSELQRTAMHWDYQAKEKADRILNASLAASKQAMNELLRDAANKIAAEVRKQVQEELKHSERQKNKMKSIVWWNLAAASVTLLAAAIAAVATFM